MAIVTVDPLERIPVLDEEPDPEREFELNWLKAVKARLELGLSRIRAGWTKGQMEDVNGNVCAMGAVQIVELNRGNPGWDLGDITTECELRLAEEIKPGYDSLEFTAHDIVTEYNDKWYRKVGGVEDVFIGAIDTITREIELV